jgi:hypothetical protein
MAGQRRSPAELFQYVAAQRYDHQRPEDYARADFLPTPRFGFLRAILKVHI